MPKQPKMTRLGFSLCVLLLIFTISQQALAVRSAELYSAKSYGYGRFEARVRFAGGDGVIGSFFLWKEGSEQPGTFWNELDFEKLGADCHLETNPIYGDPAKNHSERHTIAADLCGEFHVYAYEWTPDYIAWLVDGAEVRRETGAAALAYAANAAGGMRMHFNVWPGDATFGGNFSPDILPVHEYVDWVQFSAYSDGAFTNQWREDFAGAAVPSGWLKGDWSSPKSLSTHDPQNVNFIDGYAVLSLTADDALGPSGAMPSDAGDSAGSGGSASSAGDAGASSAPVSGGTLGAAGSRSAAGATSSASAGTASATSSDDGGCALASSHGRTQGLGSFCIAALALFLRSRRVRDSKLQWR